MGCGHRPRGALRGMREHALRLQREGVTGAARRMRRGEEEGCGGISGKGAAGRGGGALRAAGEQP